MKSPTYSLGLAIINKYLQVIIQCLEPKILNEKVKVFEHDLNIKRFIKFFDLMVVNEDFFLPLVR